MPRRPGGAVPIVLERRVNSPPEGDVLLGGRIHAREKNAIVPFPDGSKRLLHCMESPEHWFEDFGSARLTRGRAR
jgi:hypothetical protein